MKKSDKKKFIDIKDKKRLKIFYRSVYSRLIINFLFIALQIFVLAFFVFRLEKYLQVYFGFSLILSASFMIYMVNKNGRNEFKLAWIIPMIFVPLFSIAAYLMYHTNRGSRRVSKKLTMLREKTQVLLPESLPPSIEAQKEIVKELSKNHAADLIYYLTNNFFFPYTDCDVNYFSSGEEVCPHMIEAIRSAKKYIFLEYFIIEPDTSWNEIFRELHKKVKEGVEVRILCDGLGSPVISTSYYQKYLKANGFKSRVFIPIVPVFSTHLNNRDHRKMLIVDGELAFTGGLNLSNEYFNRGKKNRFAYWKDNAVQIQGQAVHTFLQLFLQSWNLFAKNIEDFTPYLPQSYKTYDCPGITIPYGDDFFNNKDIAENIYLYIINSAKKYLNITTPYVLVDNQLQEALIFAAARGVEVSIIVPATPDHLITFCIGKTYLETFVNKGIKVYLYQKGFIHAKTFISDNQIATVGSVNLDYRSLYHHFENGVVFIDSPLVDSVKADFDLTLKDCIQMQPGDYKKIKSHIRLIGRLFRIFAPLF